MKPSYNPRRANFRAFDGSRSTALWFDKRRKDRRAPQNPCGFQEDRAR